MSKHFTDSLKVHSTRDGTQYVRPSDVVMSEQFKQDSAAIRELFEHMKGESQ